MEFYDFILGLLCVWRITHLLYAEDGPWDIIFRLREKAGDRFFGKLFDCFYCLSVWTAVPFALYFGETYAEQFLLLPALSAAAILLERITNRTFGIEPAVYFEEKEDNHAMLRKTKTAVPRNEPGSPDS